MDPVKIILKNHETFMQMYAELEHLDKQFDLGFVTEERYLQEKKFRLREINEFSYNDSKLILARVDQNIEQLKLGVEVLEAEALTALTRKDGKKRSRTIEKAIKEHYSEIKDYLKLRKKTLWQLQKFTKFLLLPALGK